jgi:hypothetical protein
MGCCSSYGHQRFLDAAQGAVCAPHAHRACDGRRSSRASHDGDGANLYYLSACHGPRHDAAVLLPARITGDATYSQWTTARCAGC